MSVAHVIEDKLRTEDVHISERIEFSGLLLSPPILEGLTKSGFKRPSPIQLQAIPLGRCGLDLIVQAKSGTGKTCVFTVIALEGLNLQTDALQVLILAPTREIAIQIRDVVTSIGSCLPELKCHSFIGGTPVQQDKISLKQCHIATGTPGRIKQLIELGALKTQSIRLFVLDEADKLLGGDLTEPINWIYSSLPDNKQILALSATYPETLAQHLTRYMRNPTFVRLNITDPALIGIKQYHVIVPDSPLPNKVFEAKTEAVIKILSSVSFEQCLIFSNLQTRAQGLQSELESRNWPTQCIAGCLDQKDRSLAMEHLKAYTCRILISTDLTSRGIDADKVNMVINLDVPLDHETYLHRIGRAGRFGSHGAAISIVSKGKQEKELWAVERKCKTNIPELPYPIPSDLATRHVPLKLSDVVTTEKIITQNDSLFKPHSPYTQLQFGNGEIDCQDKEDCSNGDADGDTENTENSKKNVCDRVTKKEEFYGDCDGGGGGSDIASSKNSEIDLCTSSSLEFLSACEEKSLEEDNSETHSVNSGVDMGVEVHNSQIHFSKSIKDECVAFNKYNDLPSKETNSSLFISSDVVNERNRSSSQTRNKSNPGQQENGAVADIEYSVCKRAQKTIFTNTGEEITYPHCLQDMSDKETRPEIPSLAVLSEEKVPKSHTTRKQSDKTSVNCSPVFDSLFTQNNGAECSIVDNNKVLAEVLTPGSGDFVDNKISINFAESQVSNNSAQPSQISYKPRRQKHPRPFALSAFLRGLNESITEIEDVSENCSQSNVSNTGDEGLSESDILLNSVKENPVVGWEINQVTEIQELELCPSVADGANSFQCVDLVISESFDVSGYQRDNNEVFDSVEQINQFNETKLSCMDLADRDINAALRTNEVDIMTMKETTITKELCDHIEFHNNNQSNRDESMIPRGYSSFPKRETAPKTFSALQEDYRNFCLNPHRVNMKDIQESVKNPYSKITFEEDTFINAVCFQSSEFVKMEKMKFELKELVEKSRLERLKNPDIMNDFLKKASQMNAAEIHENTKPTQVQGKSKGGKRKKGNGKGSEALNWRNRGSDDHDWRFKKRDSEIISESVHPSTQSSKDFDELLKDQLLLNRKKEEKVFNVDGFENKFRGEQNKCVNTSEDQDWRSKTRATEEFREKVWSGKQCGKGFDELLQEQLLLKGKREETILKVDGNENKFSDEMTKCVYNISERSLVGNDNPHVSKFEVESGKEVNRNHSGKMSGNFNGARPKQLQQSSCATDSRSKPLSRTTIQTNPDKECQMLDKMHLEMLQKRKERKEKMAALKKQAESNHRNGKNTTVDGQEEVTVCQATKLNTNGTAEVSVTKSVENNVITVSNSSEIDIKPAENNDMTSDSNVLCDGLKSKQVTSIESSYKPVSDEVTVSDTHYANSTSKLKSLENDTAGGSDSGILPNSHGTISAAKSKSVDSNAKMVSDSGIEPDESIQSEADKQQNLVCDINKPQEESTGKTRAQIDQLEASTSAENTSEILDASHHLPFDMSMTTEMESNELDETAAVKHGQCRIPVPQTHLKIFDFSVKGLDLSSDSDDFDLTLSSNTDLTDIDIAIITSDEKSKSVLAARRLKFSIDEESTKRPKTKKGNGKQSSKLHKRSKPCHPPSKYHSKKHLRSQCQSAEIGRGEAKKKGKIAVLVSDIACGRLQSSEIENLKATESGETSVPLKDRSCHDGVSNQNSNLQKHLELNLSNNKSRSGEILLSKYFHHGAITEPSAFSPSCTYFLPPFNKERHKPKQTKSSNDKSKKTSYSSKLDKTNSKRKEKHRCHAQQEQSDLSNEENIDTNARPPGSSSCPSSHNWWWYWLSLYHHYIRNSQSQWTGSCSPLNPFYYHLWHYHQHQQQCHLYWQQQLPVEAWWPHYYYYHHQQTRHHLPHPYASIYHSCNGRDVASLQLHYIRHMASVMKEMTDNYGGHQDETSKSE